ncbi:MAG: LysM peptidoglycan-binding domain-containing protein [Deltaproteobacteria bacterium]|nr:LysM peptidoglycan-binding domain-containing protein [Deltaproteobacteria bacterium]
MSWKRTSRHLVKDLRVWALVLALGLPAAPTSSALAGSPEEGESSGKAPPAPPVAPRQSVAPKKKSKRATKKKRNADDSRDNILDRIRLDCDDPSTCYFGDDAGPVANEPEPLTEEELNGLLEEILAGLQAHQDAALAAGRAELSDERMLEEQYFGAADHHRAPSTAYYKSPLEVVADRPALHLDRVDPRDFDIPIVLNERVQRWMVYFLTRGRRSIVKWLGRKARYEPLIRTELAKAGLPQDLLYQSMIESGFNPYATSRAAAVGVWQFMPRTGRYYGLKLDYWVDERRDPVLATDAAIRYLTYLYKMFGNWELATSAYNAGEGKVGKAIRMYGTRDFWKLSSAERNYLKPETKHYVPKMMAAAIVCKYADRYGLLAEIEDEHRLPAWDYDRVQVEEATDLAAVAKVLGIETEDLVFMNPHLKRGFTPPGFENYELNVPRGEAESFAKKWEKVPKDERITFVRHKVRRGQTLGAIASKYGVPTTAIASLNKISDPRKLRIGQTLTIPVKAAGLSDRTITHVVSRGDTLGAIASRYGVSVGHLKQQNSLTSDTISVGQRITVKSERVATASSKSTGSKSTKSTSKSTSRAATTYTVRSGDTVSGIAAKFGTSWAALRKANSLKSDTIKVGQKLSIPGTGSVAKSGGTTRATTTYTVRSGDVLGTIASRHDMSVKDLQKLNSVSGTTIRVGQKLKVYGKAAPSKPATKLLTHVVASGEVLGTIASKYGVRVSDLQKWNSLSGTNIRVGQKLKVHSKVAAAPATKTHKVANGESLWSIAQKHKVSVADLRSWNGLKSNTLKPGQKLTIKL